MVLTAIVVGVGFNLPSLNIGAAFDDYYHQAFIETQLESSSDFPLMPREWWDLFNFCGPGGKAEIQLGILLGKYPWWTYPELRLAFLRPLSTLSHYLDYLLWPKDQRLMHAHNLLWYVGILIVLGLYYRRMIQTSWIAGLALLIYCLDEARVESVGWIASRNTLVTAFFFIVTLISYDKWRREGWRPGWVTTPVLFLITHLCSEAAWGLWAHFFAYALLLDRASPLKRLIGLLPMILISLGWRWLYDALGYGTYGTYYYIDPINSPMRFLNELPERLLVCFGEYFYFVPRNAYFGSPDIGNGYDTVLFILILLILPTAWVFFSMMRSNREMRYWLVSSLLICIPLCTVYPMPRLFLVASISASPLIAQTIASFTGYFKRSNAPAASLLIRVILVRFTQALVALLAVAWLALHIVAAPYFLLQRNASLRGVLHYGTAHAQLIPSGPELSGKTMVIINTPDLYPTLFSLSRRQNHSPVYPQHTIIIGETTNSFVLRRASENALLVMFNKGFFQSTYSLFLRDVIYPIPIGYRIKQLDFFITVERITPDGRPLAVKIERSSLDSSNLIWVIWNGRKFSRVTLPPVGRSYGYPAVNWQDYRDAHGLR